MILRSSVCAYCGCGCRLVFAVEEGKVVKVKPDKDDPVSGGLPCIKGLTLHEVVYRNRVQHPLLRDSKDEEFRRVSWGEALRFVYERLAALDPGEIFFVPSGKITNEDNYVMQKFARIVSRTNNVDSCCTRLCHAPTVKALTEVTGLGASEGRMDEVYDRDVLLIVGTDPASNYPVLFHRIVEAKRVKGLKIISVQAVYNDTARYADIPLTVKSGTEVALFNAVMSRLISLGRCDSSAERLEGFDRLREVVGDYGVDAAASICGCASAEIEAVVEMLASSVKLGVMHGMGMTQHRNTMPNIYSLLNLMMLKGGLLLSNRGEVNVQGVGDVGCQPDTLPSGSMITLSDLAARWGVGSLPVVQGKTVLEAFLISPVKAAVISNFSPAQSLPNLDEVHKSLRRMFLVVMESHRSFTDEFADVVLPVPAMVERGGSVTTGERRVRPVRRVVEPFGEAKPEWRVMCELAAVAGYAGHFGYASEEDVTREIVSVVPAYRGVNVDVLYSGGDQWGDKEVKFRRFNPVHFKGVGEDTSPRFPFIMVSFRSPHHFLTNEMTSQSETLGRFPEGPFVYLNPQAALKMGIQDGVKVRVASSVAYIDGVAKISLKVPERIVGVHFHFKSLLINRLMPNEFDPESFTPNYKAVAVNVTPLT